MAIAWTTDDKDLQINLADTTPSSDTIWTNPQTSADFDLNLDLPVAEKSEDRLKEEPKKEEIKTAETPVTPKVEETPTAPEIAIPTTPENSQTVSVNSESPVNPLESSSLTNDMKIIADLESHTSWTQTTPTEPSISSPMSPIESPVSPTPQTGFDLDAMLWTPTIAAPVPPIESPETPVPPVTSQESSVVDSQKFSVPNSQTLSTSPSPTKSIKILAFVALFIALWFVTYFIIKTMYPLGFNSTPAITILTGTELTGTELTGTELTGVDMSGTVIETLLTGEIASGDISAQTHESAPDSNFQDLENLTTTADTTDTILSKLTTYSTQGKTYLAQGRQVNNQTLVKYGLYISKKADQFTTKIESWEEISNLSWYFAQFDQYLAQLQSIAGTIADTNSTLSTTTNTNIPAIASDISSFSGYNDQQNADLLSQTTETSTQ